MTSSHTATLNLQHLHPDLPPQATTAAVLPSLQQPLLSLGQFCDSGFDLILTASDVLLKKHEEVSQYDAKSIGKRNNATGLWDIPITPQSTTIHTRQTSSTQTANNAYNMQTKRELITFLHAAAFSPTVTTWCAAIDKGFFCTWPGLTSAMVRKHLPKSMATAKGHLKEERQGLRSTKNLTQHPHTSSYEPHSDNHPANTDTTTEDSVEMTADNTARTNCFYVAKLYLDGKVASDLTGRFPTTSFDGNKYIMILYSDDANGILAQPVKNRSEQELVDAIKVLHTRINHANLPLRFHIMDNECPAGLKRYLNEQNIQYQLVPPYYHRQNPAERAIQTFKAHLISGIASANPNFPLYL